MRKDHKFCPSQVTRCEQCRVAFQTCDICVVKTTGERQRYDKNGKKDQIPSQYISSLFNKLLEKS